MGLFFGFLSIFLFSSPIQNARAADEPTCPTYSATTPTFNPFPLVLNSNSPDFTDQPCRDLPMLYWFPLDTAANNPRRLEVNQKQSITFYTYYNNGAKPGSPAITNPNLKVAVTKDREVGDRTEYRISATLSASNATTVTSAQKGGDLILSVPSTTKLDITTQQTNHWPTRLIRSELENTTGRPGNDLIPDNSAGANSWNPIYTSFEGKTAVSTTGFKLADNLAAGFLGYGLVSSQLSVDPTPPPPPAANRPPVLTGQEITIVRGQTGSFQVYTGTDPDNDVPLIYEIVSIPSFCTNNTTTRIITCVTTTGTPVKSTFTIAPIDSKGLKGSPATFIVNVIDPDLSVIKLCFKKGTQDPCGNIKMMAGEEITYQIQVKNISTVTVESVTLTDVIDTNLENIANIQPPVSNYSQSRDIVWNLGSIQAGQTITASFDAKIKANVSSKIVNTATATSPMIIGERKSTVEFTPGVEPAILDTSDKVCKDKTTGKNCNESTLTLGNVVIYTINVRNTGKGDAKNVKVVDTYDKILLTKIEKINPEGTNNTADGTITWNLANLKAGETSSFTFEATIATAARNNDKIINNARISADNIPARDVKAEFVVTVVAIKTVTTGGFGTLAGILSVSMFSLAGFYYYQNQKFTTSFVPVRSAEVPTEPKKRKKNSKKTD